MALWRRQRSEVAREADDDSDRSGAALPELHSAPLKIRTWWTSQSQATAIPGSPWRSEYVIWTLHSEIYCESTEVLVAAKRGGIPERLSWRSGARHSWQIHATFRPQLRRLDPVRVSTAGGAERTEVPWVVTNTLAVSFGGFLVETEDVGLVSDPTTLVQPRDDSEFATTGSVIQLAAVPRWRLTSEIFCVAKSDTRNSHGRWVVKPGLRT